MRTYNRPALDARAAERATEAAAVLHTWRDARLSTERAAHELFRLGARAVRAVEDCYS